MLSSFGKSIIWVFVFAFTAGFLFGTSFRHKNTNPYMIINNQAIFLEIADTPEKITQGLSGRESLPKDKGMLFVFPKRGNYPFWMNKMKFNLDFVFISGDKIVDLVESVPFPKPGQEPAIIEAKEEFDKVLEINQGVIKNPKIKIGDHVKLVR